MSTTLAFLALIFILFSFKLLRDSLFYVWLWQVKEYRIDRMMSHLRENAVRITPQPPLSGGLLSSLLLNFPLDKGGWGVVIAIILFFSYFIFLKNYSFVFQCLVLAFFAFAVLEIIKEIKSRSLKRPKLTLKIIVIYFLLANIYSLIALCWFYASLKMTADFYLLKISLLLLFILIVNPLIISLIVLAIEPIFYFQKKRIIKKAAEKMRRLKKVKVIGITGSYGKTSTKEFLSAILSQKYKVVKTEGNNNTNIGVAYTVLNKVSDEYDYFICEMGAYKIGEIKEICEIIKPSIGILTGINNQHVDLFGSRENIVKAKFELIEALPEEGLAIINEKLKMKNEKLQLKVKNAKYFSLDSVENIKVFQDYVEFDFQTTPNPSLNKDGNKKCHPELVSGSVNNSGLTDFNFSIQKSEDIEKHCGNRRKMLKQVRDDMNNNLIKFKLNLLGKHYIENILSVIMAAEHLGMSLDEIKNGIKKIKPTEYMMRKMDGLNNSIFIDDSYSANTDGVLAALDYLNEAYKGYKKIIVFPGIIELGEESEEAHKMLYNRINEVCEIAYIINNPNSKFQTCPRDASGIPNSKLIFETDFDKVAEMVKKDLISSLISNPPTPLIKGVSTVVLFESRGAGVVMGKLKMEKSK